MELAISKLSKMLSEAYDGGYGGETRDEIVSDILARYQICAEQEQEEIADEGERIYTIAELQKLPVGTVFVHQTLGKCIIQQRNGEKYMSFDTPGLAPSGLSVDSYPWDIPMKLVANA